MNRVYNHYIKYQLHKDCSTPLRSNYSNKLLLYLLRNEVEQSLHYYFVTLRTETHPENYYVIKGKMTNFNPDWKMIFFMIYGFYRVHLGPGFSLNALNLVTGRGRGIIMGAKRPLFLKSKANSVLEQFVSCLAVHTLKIEILQTT